MSASSVVIARNRLGVAARRGNPATIAEARRDLATEKIAAYVQRVVAEAPPLSDEQRDRLVAILRGGAV
ncbi:hypothetical protein [Microbacterium sp.]|uniref:hypothetical protein n=1 Tax=Microbacterium sp. TaxID=51671 RepID=UPI003736D388